MLPVVAGKAETKRQILIYTVLLMPTSLLPWLLGFAGPTYGLAATILGAAMILAAFRLRRSDDEERRLSRRLFVLSVLYLGSLFAALVVDAVLRVQPL